MCCLKDNPPLNSHLNPHLNRFLAINENKTKGKMGFSAEIRGTFCQIRATYCPKRTTYLAKRATYFD
jgi:hypothetical protein